jgi:hypothetical protein
MRAIKSSKTKSNSKIYTFNIVPAAYAAVQTGGLATVPERALDATLWWHAKTPPYALG